LEHKVALATGKGHLDHVHSLPFFFH
jgi:hypothetical protein